MPLQDKEITLESHIKCLKRLLVSHFVFQLPMMFVFHYVAPYIGIRVDHKLPAWSNIIVGTVISFMIEDFYFYWVHRLLHWGVWYKHIHKIHHEYQAPIGMAAEYAHPVETLILGFGTMLGPFICFDHIFSMYFFLFWRLFQTIEHHCAYEYPWSPSKWLPGWSGAQFHDYHHETFVRYRSAAITSV
jgi:sterol desaturase/sphingolipid hydroxylase (fatty acid hydroxylase superfamily)